MKSKCVLIREGSKLKFWYLYEQTEAAVIAYAIEQPAHGQVRASNELRKTGVFISPSGIRCVWLRNSLTCFKDRLKALEEKSAKENFILTESQVQALERKKHDDVVAGEIETAHPGYLGSQDTYYVGNLKGVGRIYQQTFIDIYAKVGFAKLYTTKTPITSADLINDKVLPFYEQHQLPLLRILTDKGTEYCGKAETHDYQLYLAVNDIEHTKTKARSPQTNGICERFHKTLNQEFYQVTFRKKIYRDIESLQLDLDQWIEYYNNERTHQGKMCCGRTPMETLEDGKAICEEKMVAWIWTDSHLLNIGNCQIKSELLQLILYHKHIKPVILLLLNFSNTSKSLLQARNINF